jgi:hypothetical protein
MKREELKKLFDTMVEKANGYGANLNTGQIIIMWSAIKQADNAMQQTTDYSKENIITNSEYNNGKQKAEVDWENDCIHDEVFENSEFEQGYTDRIKELSLADF